MLRLTNGEAFLYTATAGGGKRSRYALTSELRVPVLKPLTLTASGRYDAYRVSGATVDKATYMLGAGAASHPAADAARPLRHRLQGTDAVG